MQPRWPLSILALLFLIGRPLICCNSRHRGNHLMASGVQPDDQRGTYSAHDCEAAVCPAPMQASLQNLVHDDRTQGDGSDRRCFLHGTRGAHNLCAKTEWGSDGTSRTSPKQHKVRYFGRWLMTSGREDAVEGKQKGQKHGKTARPKMLNYCDSSTLFVRRYSFASRAYDDVQISPSAVGWTDFCHLPLFLIPANGP